MGGVCGVCGVCVWCVCGVCMMCGEFKSKMTDLMNRKELLKTMDMSMLCLMSTVDSLGFKILKFAFSA